MAAALVVVLAPWLVHARGQDATKPSAAIDGTVDHAFRDWLAALREEAHGKGISETTLDATLSDITPIRRIITLDRQQPEFAQTFWSYLHNRVNDHRIERGRKLLTEHGPLLAEIHAQYGVPPRYLVSFWGLETNFGAYTGGFRVIDALVTLAYDRRRASFFRIQLFDALQIIEEGHVPPKKMTGSWAGAMGHMQFMPSTFIGYAVDHTGDGRKDIWRSLPDAFASAANYLASMGWRPQERWGREVRLPEGFDLSQATLKQQKPLKWWSSMGVRRVNGQALPRTDMQGAIILPQGHGGPAFLVYENFRVILHWNRSVNYAIAVGHLADRIVGLPPLSSGREAAHEPLSRDEIKTIQAYLKRSGFNAGAIDGVPGPRTKAAIRAFQQKHRLPPDGYPSPSLLQFLLALPATQ